MKSERLRIFFTLLLTAYLSLFTTSVFARNTDELLKEATRFFNTGNYQQSLKAYEKILKAGVSSASIYNNIGVIYVKLFEKSKDENYLKKAISFFTLATVIDPEYKIAEKNLNEVLDSYLNEKVRKETDSRVKLIIEKMRKKQNLARKEELQEKEEIYQPIGEKEVIEFLEKWKDLWEKKDAGYFKLYSPQGCMDFERFIRYKKRIWRKSENIKVNIEDLHIRTNPDNSVCVTFRQLYSSSLMKSKARKALCLRKRNGEIKIYCEWFIPTVRIE